MNKNTKNWADGELFALALGKETGPQNQADLSESAVGPGQLGLAHEH